MLSKVFEDQIEFKNRTHKKHRTQKDEKESAELRGYVVTWVTWVRGCVGPWVKFLGGLRELCGSKYFLCG